MSPPFEADLSASGEAAETVPATPTILVPSKKSFFKSKKLKGQIYDLSHLDPFTFEVTHEDKGTGERLTFTVEANFSCHCFTEGWKEGQHAPDLRYVHRREVRAFCTDRHALSTALPGLVKTLGTRSVYFGQGRNFFYLKDNPIPGYTGPYLVFFRTMRADKKKDTDVIMHIDSAYMKPAMVMSGSSVRFSNLVASTVTGKKVTPGPRVQIKRK